ncbi:hypothetical protein I926_06520 [Pasteurella multocida subsp. multocida OH4807]|nr:hypothetical protein I926_06520 [Pasteurella multocida subsp. multocida OH4807]
MKIFTQFSLATMFALSLVACDNASKTNSTPDTTAKQAAAQLSPQEQFRHDYEKFEKWNSESEQEIGKHFKPIEEKMAAIQSGNITATPEDVDTLFAPFQEVMNKELQKLDALNLKDPEMLNYAALVKKAYQGTFETLPLIMKLSLDPAKATQELSKAEATFSEFEKNQQEMEKEKTRLKQKYEQK